MKSVVTVGIFVALLSTVWLGCETPPSYRDDQEVSKVTEESDVTEDSSVAALWQLYKDQEVSEPTGAPWDTYFAILDKESTNPDTLPLMFYWAIQTSSFNWAGDSAIADHMLRRDARGYFNLEELGLVETMRIGKADFIFHVDAVVFAKHEHDDTHHLAKYTFSFNYALEDPALGLIVARNSFLLTAVSYGEVASGPEEYITIQAEWEQ